jgi:serine/threonine protein kinase
MLKDTFVRVIDFGLSVFNDVHPKKYGGTLNYIAPEVIYSKHWSYSADMFSMGVVLFNLFTKSSLFSNPDITEPELFAKMAMRLAKPLPNSILDSLMYVLIYIPFIFQKKTHKTA